MQSQAMVQVHYIKVLCLSQALKVILHTAIKLMWELHMGPHFSTPSPPEQRMVKQYNSNSFDYPFIISHK